MMYFDPFHHSRANDRSSIKAIRGVMIGVMAGAFLWLAGVAVVWVVTWVVTRPAPPHDMATLCLFDVAIPACRK